MPTYRSRIIQRVRQQKIIRYLVGLMQEARNSQPMTATEIANRQAYLNKLQKEARTVLETAKLAQAMRDSLSHRPGPEPRPLQDS